MRHETHASSERVEIRRHEHAVQEPGCFHGATDTNHPAVHTHGNEGLHVELDMIETAQRAQAQEISERRDTLTGKAGTEPGADVELRQVRECHRVHITCAV